MGQEIVQDRVYTVYLPFRTVAVFRNMVSLNVKTNFKSIIKKKVAETIHGFIGK